MASIVANSVEATPATEAMSTPGNCRVTAASLKISVVGSKGFEHKGCDGCDVGGNGVGVKVVGLFGNDGDGGGVKVVMFGGDGGGVKGVESGGFARLLALCVMSS